MGSINLFGLVVVALGILLVFLGVTGRYQVFTGAVKGNGPTGGNDTSTSAADQAKADQQSFINGLESA